MAGPKIRFLRYIICERPHVTVNVWPISTTLSTITQIGDSDPKERQNVGILLICAAEKQQVDRPGNKTSVGTWLRLTGIARGAYRRLVIAVVSSFIAHGKHRWSTRAPVSRSAQSRTPEKIISFPPPGKTIRRGNSTCAPIVFPN